jgi:hypothetical protein
MELSRRKYSSKMSLGAPPNMRYEFTPLQLCSLQLAWSFIFAPPVIPCLEEKMIARAGGALVRTSGPQWCRRARAWASLASASVREATSELDLGHGADRALSRCETTTQHELRRAMMQLCLRRKKKKLREDDVRYFVGLAHLIFNKTNKL